MPDVESDGHHGVRVGFSVDSRNWVLGKHKDPRIFFLSWITIRVKFRFPTSICQKNMTFCHCYLVG